MKPNTEELTLLNNSSTPLAFKVKTTAPKLYCVRPNASIVKPGQSLQVSIILQGFSQPLPKDYKCKDKFLLVSLPCPDLEDPSKLSESWSALESEFKLQMVQKKLRVNYVITDEEGDVTNANATSAVGASDSSPEESSAKGFGASSPSQNRTMNESFSSSNGAPNGTDHENAAEIASGIVAASANKHLANTDDYLKKDLDESTAKVDSLSSRFDSNEEKNEKYSAAPSSPSDLAAEPSAGISFSLALVLMLISFLLGWLVL